MNDIVTIANKFDENEYFILPISKEIINGLVKINVKPTINSNNWKTKIVSLYIT